MFGRRTVLYKSGKYYLAGLVCITLLYLLGRSTAFSQLQPTPWEVQPSESRMLEADRYHISCAFKKARLISQSHPDSAIALMEDAYYKSLSYKFYDGLFESTFILGIIYSDKGEYDKARILLTKAFTYARHTSSANRDACRALNNIGNTYQYEGDYRKAVQYYFWAVSIAEKSYVMASPLTRIYNNLGLALLLLNEDEKAIYYLNRAEDIANKVQFKNHLPSIYNNKAIVYFRAGQKDTSWLYSSKALALAIYYGNGGAQFTALQNMGKILVEEKKPLSAIPYLKAALRIQGNINPYYFIGAQYALGCAYLASGNVKEAQQYLNAALEEAKERKTPTYISLIKQQLALLHAEKSNYRLAYQDMQAAFNINDSLLNKENIQAINTLEVKYRTVQKDKEIAKKQLFIQEQERSIQQKNIWLTGIAVSALMLAIVFIAVYRSYRNRLKLQAKEREITQLMATMQGEEKERTRVSQELHDGIGSVLAAVKMNFTAIQNSHPFLSDDIKFHSTMNLLDDMYHELRQAAHNLTPEILIRHGLSDSINIYCEQIRKSKSLSIAFQAYGSFDEIDSTLSLIIYRTLQELVHNIIKHAQATDTLVQLYHHDHLLSLMVEDNGIGFDVKDATGGIGLQNIQSRIKNLNGRLTIDSQKNTGTTVYLEFDLQKTGKTLAV